MKDNNDVEIEVGNRVVFNRSGELELGEIVKITPREKSWSGDKQYWFHVKPDRFPNISKVKNPQSIMVIK